MQNNNDYNALITFAIQIEDTSSPPQTEETPPRKIPLKYLPVLIMGILLIFLFAFSLITYNFEIGRIIMIIYTVFVLSSVLLSLSTKDPTKFQPSLKELYRKLFKDAPSSYFVFGLVILIGLNFGIFSIYVLFVCVEWNNFFCNIMLYIFAIILVLGLILMALGLILTVKKGLKLRRQGLS